MSNSDEEDTENEINLGTYEGERNEDEERHGTGKAVLPNGDKYEGQYANGKRHGQGTYTCGAKYVGSYVRNKKEGQGTFYHIDHSRYEGSWSNDVKSGHGVYYYANGDRYEGEWFENKRHGRGIYYYKVTGSIFDGRWLEGKWHGSGELIHKNHRFVGMYDNGLPTGKGRYAFDKGFEQHGRYYNKQIRISTNSVLDEEDEEIINIPIWKASKIVESKKKVKL